MDNVMQALFQHGNIVITYLNINNLAIILWAYYSLPWVSHPKLWSNSSLCVVPAIYRG
jgi:hypothetical protein